MNAQLALHDQSVKTMHQVDAFEGQTDSHICVAFIMSKI